MNRFFIISMFILCSCSSYDKAQLVHSTELFKNESVGLIGCPAEKITVKVHKDSYFISTWEATCKGKRFFCSRTASGAVNSNCKPELL